MEGLSACECPVCFQLLNHSTHEPMSMPCGHTLCKVTIDMHHSDFRAPHHSVGAREAGLGLGFVHWPRCVCSSWLTEQLTR